MQRILSTDLAAHETQTVTIAGWVHRRRLLKSVAFLIVRDAAGFSQVVITGASAALRDAPDKVMAPRLRPHGAPV